MCGIGGIINLGLGRDALEQRLLAIQRSLRHRGPDDEGLFLARDGRAGLVSTRLSILDLSTAGHQPMASADGRYHIVFNGEIYNFMALREELERAGETFISRSDTEVILKMYARYGPDCVREFEGMFAIAIWDKREQICFLARDPFGVKPLYYHDKGGVFVFASEIRSLLGSGLIARELSPSAVHGYLLFGTVAEPSALIQGVSTLPAGHHLTWRDGRVRSSQHWGISFGAEPFAEDEAKATVRSALEDSVCRHMISDVPVGVFLSGGIDSTALVALASRHQGAQLQTFCISLDDPEFNEGEVAARTAKHFGTRHFDLRLDSATARQLLHSFLDRSDLPSIDGYNTFCVAKHAHDCGIKVVLSGLGGDELFGGYPSFHSVPQMFRISRRLNGLGPLRTAAGRLLEWFGKSPRSQRLGRFIAERPTSTLAYWCMRGIFTPAEATALLGRYFPGQIAISEKGVDFPVPEQPTLEDEVSYLELTRYMRNQLLRDSDVMSMAWSLELRVPYVDATFVNAIQRIPAGLRLTPGKQLLSLAVPEIPDWVRGRRKQGFTFPFERWITREWSDVFDRIDRESPVRLHSWYRRWCLFALDSFIQRNRIEMRPASRRRGVSPGFKSIRQRFDGAEIAGSATRQ
jgi:asparagine synthase (glutamine-hydrolysing)